MKKILLLTALWLMWMVGSVFAAMECVETSRVKLLLPGQWHFTMTCTFDTTPGTAVDTFPTDAPAGASMSMMGIINQGLLIYNMSITPGTIGPTDDSDLQITDSAGVVYLSATGNGKDVIDNATKTSQIMGDGPGGTSKYIKGNGLVLSLTVTNNVVNNSSFVMGFDTLQP